MATPIQITITSIPFVVWAYIIGRTLIHWSDSFDEAPFLAVGVTLICLGILSLLFILV